MSPLPNSTTVAPSASVTFSVPFANFTLRRPSVNQRSTRPSACSTKRLQPSTPPSAGGRGICSEKPLPAAPSGGARVARQCRALLDGDIARLCTAAPGVSLCTAAPTLRHALCTACGMHGRHHAARRSAAAHLQVA
jgi:hypothetical protein